MSNEFDVHTEAVALDATLKRADLLVLFGAAKTPPTLSQALDRAVTVLALPLAHVECEDGRVRRIVLDVDHLPRDEHAHLQPQALALFDSRYEEALFWQEVS